MLVIAATYVAPEGGWFFPVISLFAPYIYMVTFALALWWLAIRRWQIAFMLFIVIGIASMWLNGYYNVALLNRFDVQSTRGIFRVVSFNATNDTGLRRHADSVAQYLSVSGAQIVALQRVDDEVATKLEGSRSLAAFEQYRLGEMMILSRYDILNRDSIWVERSGSIAQIADVVVSKDTLRIINAQLTQSLLTQREYDDERRSLWMDEYGVRAEQRAAEAEVIDSVAVASPYRVILAVAMEDVASSYTYNRIASNLHDTFVGSGNVSANNYLGRHKQRLEYILISDRVACSAFYVNDYINWSPHQMVSVDLKIEQIK